MALSNRNSRPISVGNVEFRWAVSSRSQGDNERVLVIVQPPNDGQRLVVEVPCRDPYLNIQEPKPVVDVRDVTPGLVRRFMDDATAMGWRPDEGGKDFRFQLVIATLRDEGGENGATCHVSWQCPSCDEWFSEDVEYGERPPLLASCGRTKHHVDSAKTHVVLFW